MRDAQPENGDSIIERGGAIDGSAGQPAFTLTRRSNAPLPVLLAVPHAGRVYPSHIAVNMRNPAASILRLEDRFVDLVARDVARETGAGLLVAHAPRAMIDLNRAPEDMDWDMVAGGLASPLGRLAAGRRARSGLGLVPRRLPGLGEIWKRRISEAELANRIERIHRPYHAALADALEDLRDKWGAALLLDLHSMPPLGPKRGEDPGADFVIGDRFGASCEGSLVTAALDSLGAGGWRAAHNRPYAGGYVLDRHAAPARSIHALQVEICRAAYLDLPSHEPGPQMERVAAALAALVRRLAGDLSAGAGLAQAAE